MLKKENRLTKKEFSFVFKNGKKKFSKNFMFLKYNKNGDAKNSLKISSSVSKKIYKNAVDRNKVRRIVYNILKNNIGGLEGNF